MLKIFSMGVFKLVISKHNEMILVSAVAQLCIYSRGKFHVCFQGVICRWVRIGFENNLSNLI